MISTLSKILFTYISLLPDHAKELKKLNVSLLFNFMELVETLVKNPNEADRKVECIRNVMINMHHLLNSYRPHQARQTLITMLRDQISDKKKQLASLDESVILMLNFF